jgi:terminal uridylyltransferase
MVLGPTDPSAPGTVKVKLLKITKERIAESTQEYFSSEEESQQQKLESESAAHGIKDLLDRIVPELNINGEVHLFGSFSNGFRSANSDLDIAFVGDLGSEPASGVLGRLADRCEREGFSNVTRIFQANVPVVKLTHSASGLEVDLCVNNRLGVRNSYLLLSYCCYDSRVADLGRLVKAFVKSRELVGTADGFLNSYAYMLLVIHYCLYVKLTPNLQEIAEESVFIERWDVKFCEDLSSLPKSKCTLSLAELIVGFFHYYAYEFKWSQHAVCIRQCQGSRPIDKYTLQTQTSEEQCYVEDPFDLKHNLAGKCTQTGRQLIQDAFKEASSILQTSGNWMDTMGKPRSQSAGVQPVGGP